MIKEAEYIFRYDRYIRAETVINSFVDPVENRRFWNKPDRGLDLPMENALNYRGTGTSEIQTIYPKIVHEELLPDLSREERNFANLLYYLPDVDAYATARYFELYETPDYPPQVYFEVKLLDKLPKDSTEQ